MTEFKEIDAYVKWCKENCTNALYKGIELSAENYKKASISMSECERQPVANNEQGGNSDLDKALKCGCCGRLNPITPDCGNCGNKL